MAPAPSSHSLLAVCAVILAWYASNIGVLILNKFLLSGSSFRQPVFLTFCHMLACVILGGSLTLLKVFPLQRMRSTEQVKKVFLLAVIFCLTLVLNNISLKYIPASFSQAVGATTPLFTALFAVALMGARETTVTYLALIPIVVGIILSSGGEPLFHVFGFCMSLGATAARALKSVVQAILLTDPSEKLDPLSLLFYMSAFSVSMLVPATLILEPSAFWEAGKVLTDNPTFRYSLILNCLLAYAVNLCNFLVTKYTSALTLQVLGQAKGVIAAIISVWVFANPVTWTGMIGYAITITGVMMYSEAKRRARLQSVSDKAALESIRASSADPSDGLSSIETTPLLGSTPKGPGTELSRVNTNAARGS